MSAGVAGERPGVLSLGTMASLVDSLGKNSSFGFQVEPFSAGELRVLSFRGTERISRLYSFEIRVALDSAVDTDESSLLGLPATLQIAGDRPRLVQGLIASIRYEGRLGAQERSQLFRMRLVPRFESLKRRVRSRVFQDMTTQEIVISVLGNLANDWRLNRQYAKRAYCVQYQESDYAFIARIVAEEGIFWWLSQPAADDAPSAAATETIVFADEATGYGDLDSIRVRLRDRTWDGSDVWGVTRFERARSLRSDAVLVRNYDFERPLFNLRGEAASDDAASAAAAAAKPDDQWYADHGAGVYEHLRDHEMKNVTDARAAMRLEQRRTRADVVDGDSGQPQLAPGCRFALEAFEEVGLSGDYAVVSVEHEGNAYRASEGGGPGIASEATYRNKFSCVPAAIPARPKRPKRHHRSVMETAVVVGPQNEEIYTDELGRIKVEFHWDILGKGDDKSSCWLRHVTAWAGPHFGTQFVPRVGMEVMVSFLGGDQDCPVVIGCVYNATHPPPFALPQEKTRSGIRTQTTPGGGGSNELRFEDRKGQEQIFVHAQRDLDEVVARNHTVEILGDELVEISGSRGSNIVGSETEVVHGTVTRTVKKDENIRVEGSRIDVVEGGADITVKGPLTTRTGGDRREVTGPSELVMSDDYLVRSVGNYINIVGKNEAKRSFVLRVEGTTQISGSGETIIDAEKSITLRCGKSFLKISADKIEIAAQSVSAKGEGGGIVADDKVAIRAKEQVLVDSKEIILKTPDASIGMKKDVHVDGHKILLNSPDQATDPPKDTSPPPTKIALKDKSGKPLAYQRFLIKLADGSKFSGILDADGATEMPVDAGGSITFPDLAKHGLS